MGAFTVGAVSLPDIRLGHPRFEPATTMGNTFAGLIGGLAVFSRALSDEEIARLHEAIALNPYSEVEMQTKRI